MNIGNRKKRSDDEYIPVWEKKCDIDLLQCQYCMNYDRKKQWCLLYMDEYIQHLKNGKKMR
jgi:hypothetical protein